MTPTLNYLGIVTANMAESLRFYKVLGVPVPTELDDHVSTVLPNGMTLAWDTVELMTQVCGEWPTPTGHRLGVGFDCGSAAGVDDLYAAVLAAGFRGSREPWDAFWGQRYAQVVDPDGNLVDLFAAL